MRLETCIRKGLRLKAHRVVKVEEDANRLVATIEWIPNRLLTCGRCSRRSRKIHSRQRVREWRDLSVRDQGLVLRYEPRRVRCPACGPVVEHLPWANRWQRVTRALARSIAVLSRVLSWREAAAHFGVDWKTVATVVKRAVEWGLKHRPWKPLHVIGLDEVSRSKGQRYLTLVYDLERRQLVWAGADRDSDTMRRFFAWLGPRRARSIQTVCCDMWSVYIDAVRQHLPQAIVVFDRFHVVQHLNRAVDDVRRETWRQLRGPDRSAFKKTRWLWLKNPWMLKPDEKTRLSALCRKNQPIVRAYYLKEAFQRFWDYKREGWSFPYLTKWLWWASHSRLAPFQKFARMIREHLEGILAWTTLRVSNGALEAMNNNVKAVSHRAHGYRTVATYVAAIWHSLGNLPLEPA
jgi:transposase